MEYNKLPDLVGWATLRLVVERGGVLEAARAMSVGQPAITKRLRALDKAYGLPLMERVGGRLRLTPAGEKVYMLAVQTLDRQAAMAEELNEAVHGRKALSLEVSFAIGEHFLPKMLVAFAARYPDYRVTSSLGYRHQIQRHLASGKAELALMESAPDHPEILVQKWRDDELWLVCGAGHPLAGTDMLPIEALEGLVYVLRERQSSVSQAMEEALTRIGVVCPRAAMEVGSTDAIVDILTSGQHVSFLPRFAVHEQVLAGALFHIKVSGFRIMRTLWIARHRTNLDHPVAEAFIDMIRHGEEERSPD